MTLSATDGHCLGPANGFAKEVVKRIENIACLGVMAGGHLLDFLRVAAPAVLRCDKSGDPVPIVIHGVHRASLSLVAGEAIHALRSVLADLPFVDERRGLRLMAGYAGLPFLGDRSFR